MQGIPRRFLVLFALLFWQGGFLFYSAVVVPVGRATLPQPALQSLVTREATFYLNLVGGVALVVLALDVLKTRDASPRKGERWRCWLLMAVALAVLLWLHTRLGEGMDREPQPSERTVFYLLHLMYLIAGTVQWLGAMLFLVLTLRAWQAEDREGARSGAA